MYKNGLDGERERAREFKKDLSMQQIMSYSKSSLSHYHTSAKEATNLLVVPYKRLPFLSRSWSPFWFHIWPSLLDAHVCIIVQLPWKIKLKRIQNIYICFAIFSVIVYQFYLALTIRTIVGHVRTCLLFPFLIVCAGLYVFVGLALFVFDSVHRDWKRKKGNRTSTTRSTHKHQTPSNKKKLFIYFFIFTVDSMPLLRVFQFNFLALPILLQKKNINTDREEKKGKRPEKSSINSLCQQINASHIQDTHSFE